MRQLLACLVHVGLEFPELRAPARAAPAAPGLSQLVDCFRSGEPLLAVERGLGEVSVHPNSPEGPLPPRTPPPTPVPVSAMSPAPARLATFAEKCS